MRNEALVFAAADMLSLGVAGAIPATGLSGVIGQIIPWADAGIYLLFATFVMHGNL